MDFDWPTYFECAACSAALPAKAVEYDALGYPLCPECGARTGPLASLDAAEAAGSEISGVTEGAAAAAVAGGGTEVTKRETAGLSERETAETVRDEPVRRFEGGVAD